MRKVLYTSTALVLASASFAAAEVTLSGGAEMGIVGGEGDDVDTQFFQDMDIDFTAVGETDGGLAYGANVDLDEAGNLGDELTNQGVDIFISGTFGTLTMGDTDGALDFVMQEANAGSPGSIADDETVHPGYFGAYHDGAGAYDGQIVRYDYTFDAFTFALSVEQAGGDDGDVNTTVPEDIDPGFAVGAGYDTEFGGTAVGIGVGFQSVAEDALGAGADAAEIFGVSADVSTGGLSAAIQVTGGDVNGREDSIHVGVGASYTFDAFTGHVNFGQFDYDDDSSASGVGVALGYDLGGGAELLFGYGDGEFEDAAGNTTDYDSTFSFGLSLAF
jgi:outer membrane protein OmpU